jgi:hypothetical protein
MSANKNNVTTQRQIPRAYSSRDNQEGNFKMSCATTKAPSEQPEIAQLTTREQSDRLDKWLLRSHRTLHYVAKLILGSSELAATAVERSRLRALEDSPSFEHEGPFRSWIFRVLIDEALSIIHRDHASISEKCSS